MIMFHKNHRHCHLFLSLATFSISPGAMGPGEPLELSHPPSKCRNRVSTAAVRQLDGGIVKACLVAV